MHAKSGKYLGVYVSSREPTKTTYKKLLVMLCTGHRSTKPQSLPLRRGMMHYAYSRHVPVQIVITSNKEAVISEKDMSAHFGQTLIVGYSDVIDPKVGSNIG